MLLACIGASVYTVDWTLPRLQAGTLELQYVVANGEIVKTPDWVRRWGGLDEADHFFNSS